MAYRFSNVTVIPSPISAAPAMPSMGAPNLAAADQISCPGNDDRVERQPRERERGEADAQPDKFGQHSMPLGGELRKNAGEEDCHLGFGQIVYHALTKRPKGLQPHWRRLRSGIERQWNALER